MDGIKAFEDQDYVRAVIELQQAYRLACNAHVALFNIARSEESLGRTSDAIANYVLYLARANPDPDRTAEVQAKIAALKKQLKAKKP
jgi:hypothetical protein